MKRRKTHEGDNGQPQQNQHQHHQQQGLHLQLHQQQQQQSPPRNYNQDDDYIPLPIQTFLWRQTSPFVRPFLVKKAREMAQLEQRDACKLFERIIITNNIWGQSPSLTDAIASIDRWRLIKVSFPFVLQCTAALLNNKLIKDHNFNRLGGNEAKMMYTLQWILMNASEECADSENEAKAKSANAAIVAATAASLLKPSSATGTSASQQQQTSSQAGSTSSTGSAGAIEAQAVASGGASTVLAARAAATAASAAAAGQPLPTPAAAAAISPGPPIGQANLPSRLSSLSIKGQSVIYPVASTAATSALAVAAGSSPSVAAATLQMHQTSSAQLPSSSTSVSPINSTTTPTKQALPLPLPLPLTPTALAAQQATCAGNYLLPISSIQMFVYYFAPIMDGLKHSDFLSTNQRLEIGAALWEPLFSHQLPSNIQCLTAPLRPLSAACLTSREGNPSSSSSSFFGPASKLPVRNHLQQTLAQEERSSRRRSSAFQQLDQQGQFGDVFLGGPTASTPAGPQTATGIPRPPADLTSVPSVRIKRSDLVEPHLRRLHGTSNSPSQAEMLNLREIPYATYLDVAVLRCLFISDWQESGVFWAVSFLANRLEEIQYGDEGDTSGELCARLRAKSKSLSCLEKNLLCLADGSSGFPKRRSLAENKTPETTDGSGKEEKQQKSSDKSGNKSSYLRVDDAETSDSGDNSRDGPPKSPVRRLSFSSGMQTLANQIRKTSKRVKKAPDGSEKVVMASESQMSVQEATRSSPSRFKMRRSSSAEDLTSGQTSALLSIHDSNKENRVPPEAPVITVSSSNQRRRQARPVPAKRSRLDTSNSGRETGELSQNRKQLVESLHSKSLRQLERLTRSQTVPSNLHISHFETRKQMLSQTDSMGASHYIDDQGRIDPIVVLKVLHSLSMRENACSQRVCDKILSIMLKLVNIGILKENFNFLRRDSSAENAGKDLSSLLPTRRQHQFRLLLHDSAQILRMDSEQLLCRQQQLARAAARAKLIHKILMDITFRLQLHLGCPNHCGMESTVDHHHRNYHSRTTSANNHSVGAGKSCSLVSDASGKQLRQVLRTTMEFLSTHNQNNFVDYVRAVVEERPVQQLIDMLHSILGFCRSDYLNNLAPQTTSQSQQAGSHSVQFEQSQGGVLKAASGLGSVSSAHSDAASANSGDFVRPKPAGSPKQANESLESLIVNSSFKPLISRLASINKELKLQENTALYCDIRRLVSLIRDNFNGVFRGIIMSALIDCGKILNQQQQQQQRTSQIRETIQQRDLTRPPSDDESSGQQLPVRRTPLDGATQMMEADSESGGVALFSYSSGSMRTGQQEASPLQHRTSFGSCRYYPAGEASGQAKQSILLQQDQQHSQSTGILSLSKAKKRLEQVFGGATTSASGGGSSTSNKTAKSNTATSVSHHGEELSGASGVVVGAPATAIEASGGAGGSQPGEELSRRASLVGHQSVSGSFQESRQKSSGESPRLSTLAGGGGGGGGHLRLLHQNQQMFAAVQTGMSNFSFLMESCTPGDFLDPALLAALLDLKSPIAIRAAIYLECANFVNRCNRGQWPSWMKLAVSSGGGGGTGGTGGLHRGSNAGISHASAAARFRKSSSMQRTVRSNTLMYRAAGRAFYSWAEAVGARLEELIQLEQEQEAELIAEQMGLSQAEPICSVEPEQDVDFFQLTLANSSSPFALKMVACQLLFEVTTFLRETYRYLPPSIIHQQPGGASKLGDKMTSIYDVSRAVTANRRWSMALSSLGFGQFPALSAISSAASAQAASQAAAAAAAAAQPSTSLLRNPSTTVISEHPERRISFILHEETNDEGEQQQQHLEGPDSSGKHQRDSQGEPSLTGSITSPIAPSVNTNEQQEAAMRKLTSGRNLSQSSASSAVVVAAATCLLRSSGVIDTGAHRRKSIKLRKPNQEKEAKADKRAKFAQDFEEEIENSSVSDAGGVRRTDSIRSRRRVSGISEKSDNSDQRQQNGHLQQLGHQHQNAAGEPQPAELSGDESAGNGSVDEPLTHEASERIEADESRLMSNMPWFRAIALVNSSIDCACAHYPTCRPNCYKLHQNMCKRLVSCVQSIYESDPLGARESFAASMLENLMNCQANSSQQATPGAGSSQKGLVRAGSDCSASVLAESGSAGGEPKLTKKERKAKKQAEPSAGSSAADSPAAGRLQQLDQQQQQQQQQQRKPTAGSQAKLEALAGGGISYMLPEALKALTAVKAKTARDNAQRIQEEAQIVKYLKGNVKSLLHCPMSSFLKGAVILPRDNFPEIIRFSWNLLLEDDQQLSRTAAVGFIIAAIKCPSEASRLLLEELESEDASRKVAAIQKFYVIWDSRYQCWPRLEDGAFVHFKMAPPSIEFTLPSPKIAQESRPVVDPPWMPRKTSNVEEVTIGQDQTVQKSFVTATKTRRKQQIEIVTRALREKHDKLREDRENYHITSVPITLYAAYEPTLSNQPGSGGGGNDEMDGLMGGGGGGGGAGSAGAGGGNATADEDAQQENRALFQMKTAQALFPTCLCQAAIVMINLLDDSRVTFEGSAVYEIASKVIWSCLLEDPALFLRHFFERLTRQNQSTIFQVLRRLIRFMPRLPPQAAYTLYNYLIGFIIYYIRCPVESSQKLISDTLSVLCLTVPSVYGLFLKDLKQILRKEQCDHNLLITANVPSAKKIIVHGSDSSGIPSQFPIDESTQFYHILVDSLEFFGIEKPKQNDYFLIDVRSNHMHNVHSYVRDFYSFKRSQHPQLQLINMDPSKAFEILQKQELINQFLEFGKVSMSLAIVKSHHMAVQRVLFLHEELMKLPTFPRKAMETNFCLFRGPLGHQVFSMDRIHKICWVRVIARMFELTSGFFLQLGDIQLFLNAISGIFVLHCEEASVSRLCLATFINATYQFKSIFASDGFMTIMATIVQVYSDHQNNQLLCRSIEFVCKQFYIMHRKPFLLQLFGSVAARLNTAELMQQNQTGHPLSVGEQSSYHLTSAVGAMSSNNNIDASRISPAAFFRLLQSLEKSFKDPLDILELVEAEKPLRAVDFCYQQDKEAIEILDIISLCVTVTAYASDSPRSTQMLIILETVVPLYMKFLSSSTSKKAGQSMGKQAHKDELQKIQSISVCIRTLIVNCEGLTRNFSGPLPSIDFRSSSIRRTTAKGGQHQMATQQQRANNSAGSPMDIGNIQPEEISFSGVPETGRGGQGTKSDGSSKQATIAANTAAHRSNKTLSAEESEITRGEFIVPRDTLLNLVAEFLALSTGRLMESAKKYVDLHQKHSSYELLDVKSHLRLAEIANSLLKFASTDPTVMACRGLIRYMNEILPNTEWRQEAIRPALIMILKRLDKTFNRIAKKTWVKRSTDWEGAKQLLKGAYLTFVKHPYIVHLPHLKSLISCCQNIILSDGLQGATSLSSAALFHSLAAGPTALQSSQSASAVHQQQQQQQQERERSGNLLNVTGQTASGLSPSGSNSTGQATSAPVSTGGQPSFGLSGSHQTGGSGLSERFAAAAAAAVQASSSSSISSQGFNSVTIRLIAMQLLQTGDSQTLESFIGSTATNTPDKLEALMLNFLYPMCIRVCSGAKEAPKLRVCDIMYILNMVLSMLAPQSASSKSCSSTVSSPKAATDTSQFILSKITTTIGSTQTGATALGIVGQAAHSTTNQHHQMAQHQEALKIGFLGLKILCVCFEAQLASEWIRITRVIRDLALQQQLHFYYSGGGSPSGPLWDFLDFVATYRFPMFILLLPMIKCQLAKKVRDERFLIEPNAAAHNAQCQRLIGEKIQGCPATVCRSKSFLFVSLTAELRMLKEQLIAKRRLLLEGERNQSNMAAGFGSGSGAFGISGNASLSPNQLGPGSQMGPDGQQTDHSFTAYHRLSAALASFANQTTQAKGTAGGLTGTGAALKGACFAAQLATSTPIGAQMSSEAGFGSELMGGSRQPGELGHHSQSSVRLSGAKTREEARKVMNTILRRTSFPHNQPPAGAALGTSPSGAGPIAEQQRKNSQPQSPGKTSNLDLEAGRSSQLIMDPAMLMAAAFPAPSRKSPSVENSGILKQLVQTIDRNQKQRQSQSHQLHSFSAGESSLGPSASGSELTETKGRITNASHKHV